MSRRDVENRRSYGEFLRGMIDSGQTVTAFVEAARAGHIEIVQELLERGWEVDSTDQAGITALLLQRPLEK